MASDEHHQRWHERRRTIDDVLTAQRIACQAGNELAKMLEAALVAGVEPTQNERRDPVHRSRLIAVAMNYFDQAFKPSVAE